MIAVTSASSVKTEPGGRPGRNESSPQRVATTVNTSDEVVMTMFAFMSAWPV